MKKAFINILFVIGVTFCLEIVTLWIYSAVAPQASNGWDAIADFLGVVFISSLIILGLSIFLATRLTQKIKQPVAIVTGLITMISMVGLYFYFQRQNQPPPGAPTRPTKPAAEAMSLQTETIIPEWLVKLDFKPSETTYFYDGPAYDAQIVDSIVFSERGSIDMAPPWLNPYYMKTDYQILIFEAVSRTNQAVQVQVNQKTSQTHWLRKTDAQIWDTPRFLLNCHSVELLEPENNLLRIKPMRHASPIPQKNGELLYQPIEVKGDWLKVKVLNADCSPTDQEGWILWKDRGQVAVSYNIFC